MDPKSESAPATPSAASESAGSWWSVKRTPSTATRKQSVSRKSWIKKAFGGRDVPPVPEAEAVPAASTPGDSPTEKPYDPVCPWETEAEPLRKQSAPVAPNSPPAAPVAVRSKSEGAVQNPDTARWNSQPASPPSSDHSVRPFENQPNPITVPLSPPASRPNSELLSAVSPTSGQHLPSHISTFSSTPPSRNHLPSPPHSAVLPSPPPSAPPSIPLPRPPSPPSEDGNLSDGSHYDDDEFEAKSPIKHKHTIQIVVKAPTKQPPTIIVEEEVIYDEEDRLLISEDDWGEYVEECDDDSSDLDGPHYTYDEGYKLIDQMYEDDFADDLDEIYGEHELKNMMTMMDIELALKNLFPSEQFMLGGEIYAH